MNRIQALTPCLDDAQCLALAVGDDDACDDDARQHASDCETCRRRLAATRADLAPLRVAPQVDQSLFKPLAIQRDASPVTRLGRYEIVEELGRGGQAAVYLARHPTLKVDVVLKVGHFPLHAATSAAEDDDYLVREGRLLKQLHHPNLAQVHDLEFIDDEQTGERRPVLVIEHVRGRPLRDVAKERKFAPREAAQLVAKVARAAACAHAVGVFHRDVTPANVMIDAAGEPRLIDFGLARYRHAWGERYEPVGPDYGSGTRGYRAPEQADGRNDDVDARTDVYGLGALLQRLLIGDAKVRSEADEQFGARVAELRESGVGAKFRRIVERAMRSDPAERYESAIDLADALERAAKPTRGLIYFAAAVIALVVFAAVRHFAPVSPTPVGPQAVLVPKGNEPLEDTLPLTENVRASLRVNVPRDAAAVLLQVDPTGEVEVHTDLVRTRSHPTFDTMEYWPGGFQFGSRTASGFVADPPGTKLFLVVALKGRTIDETELRRLTDTVRTVASAGWLPDLGTGVHAYSRLWPDGVDDVRAAPDRSTTAAPTSASQQQVDTQLRRLLTALRTGGWTSFAGVAVPYEPSKKASPSRGTP